MKIYYRKKSEMEKSKAFAIACLSFAAGILTGVILAPVKGGFGTNTTYVTHHHHGDEGEEN